MSFLVVAGTQAMSAKTTADIITAVRSNLNEASAAFWTDAELLEWTNQIVQDIAIKTLCLGTTEDVTIAASTLEYALTTTDYIACVAAIYNNATGLYAGTPQQVGREAAIEEPAYFYLWDGNIGLYPVQAAGSPSVGNTVRVYLAQAPAVVASGDTIPLPAIFDKALIEGVTALAFMKDRLWSRAAAYQASYDAKIDRFRTDFYEPQLPVDAEE